MDQRARGPARTVAPREPLLLLDCVRVCRPGLASKLVAPAVFDEIRGSSR
jgi:hypothetical protein